MWTDEDRLEMLDAVGAEEFDTGKPEKLRALHEGEFNEPELSGIPIEGELRFITCRISDVKAHELVKRSRLVRVKTGETFFVQKFEPNASTGLVVIRLGK